MRLAAIVAVSTWALFACNAGETQPADLVGVTSQPLVTPELPATPRTPSAVAWTAGMQLVPSSARSAYAVILKDPLTTGRVEVFIYDVERRTTLIVVSASTADMRAMSSQFTIDVSRARVFATREGLDFYDGWLDGVGGKPPPPPPGVHDQRFWDAAWNHYQVDQLVSQSY